MASGGISSPWIAPAARMLSFMSVPPRSFAPEHRQMANNFNTGGIAGGGSS